MVFGDMTSLKTARLTELRRQAKLRLLQMHYESQVGHIGGNLSALDILVGLYHFVLGKDDLFVLSKGHAAGALYVTLWSVGVLSDDDLQQFHRDGTLLSGHPPVQGIPEIVFATGSLGHGLGLSAGLALGKMLRQETGRVFCLTSDGEWNEGSCWEALIFIAHHRLAITMIMDCNGLQGFGSTREVADLEPLAAKFEAFGIRTVEIDGHDMGAICSTLEGREKGPVVVIARTVKGFGVSFMEHQVSWHYLPMSQEQIGRAHV